MKQLSNNFICEVYLENNQMVLDNIPENLLYELRQRGEVVGCGSVYRVEVMGWKTVKQNYNET
jgi:hypothetical protein